MAEMSSSLPRKNRIAERKRTMPMVPEKFGDLVVSRQGVFLKSNFLAQSFCKFFPNLNIPKYREQLDEDKKNELDKRTSLLRKHTVQNHVERVSESSWEADIRSDVFGKIRGDTRLRIDKRPVEFIETSEDNSEVSVKKRIPDATMGLHAYNEYELENGDCCDTPGCKEDHSLPAPHPALSKKRIDEQINERDCGLVVDGVWGKSDIIFPWAVYEAKKRATSYEASEAQIYEAMLVYLGMLDDLARDPNDVNQYQYKDSDKYQVFGFTSNGPQWGVYCAWKFLGKCQVETIWEGVVSDWSRAYDLLCIVDQIHEFAVTQHRDFVVKHLEAWHQHYEDIQEKKKERRASANDHDDFIYSLLFDDWKMPKWEEVKCTSKTNQQMKSAQKREEKNRSLLAQVEEVANPPRKRGRPRLERSGSPESSSRTNKRKQQSDQTDKGLKRKRGRPRLNNSVTVEEIVVSETDKPSSKQMISPPLISPRRRGRPRKIQTAPAAS